jgi:hypothetical protein
MKLLKNIPNRIFCLLLMIHLLAVNMQLNGYLRIINATTISKEYDLEEESESNGTNKKIADTELDDFIHFLNPTQKNPLNISLEYTLRHTFHFSENSLPIVHFEIQSPPPRV